MKLRIDYHFHPNLSKNEKKARRKCEKIWEVFRENDVKCVVVTEHSYKNPKRAFDFMKKTEPDDLFCFPGVEYVTKEGIDIVVFSDKDDIYKSPLIKSFELSYEEVLDYVFQNDDLYSYVTHPYTLGLTSVIKHLDKHEYLKSVEILGAVEVSNGAFDNLEVLFRKFPFKNLFVSKLEGIEKTKELPENDYPKNINFLAAGSDAHFHEEIGNCYEIEVSDEINSESGLFEIISINEGKGIVCRKEKTVNYFVLLKSAFTVFDEYLIKKFLKFK